MPYRHLVDCGGHQTFLRALGIEITFSQEGRTGAGMIRGSTSSTVSLLPAVIGLEAIKLILAGGQRINNSRADDADGADASQLCFRIMHASHKRMIPDAAVRYLVLRSAVANLPASSIDARFFHQAVVAVKHKRHAATRGL